jgi:hypothetical protein
VLKKKKKKERKGKENRKERTEQKTREEKRRRGHLCCILELGSLSTQFSPLIFIVIHNGRRVVITIHIMQPRQTKCPAQEDTSCQWQNQDSDHAGHLYTMLPWTASSRKIMWNTGII